MALSLRSAGGGDASPSSSSLTLPALYSRALTDLTPIFSDRISTSDSQAQAILANARRDLDLATRMISTLGVFSENEGIEDIGERELVFMALGWVRAEVVARCQTAGIEERVDGLEDAKSSYTSFLSLLVSYHIPFPPELEFLARSKSDEDDTIDFSLLQRGMTPRDPSARREAKIKQYRIEKEMRAKIEANLNTGLPTEALARLLDLTDPSSSVTSTNATSSNLSPEDLKSLGVSLLQYLSILAISSLSSIVQELDLLKGALGHARVQDESRQREDQRRQQEGSRSARIEEEDRAWKLDQPIRGSGSKSDLIDDRGRPTQPFTILPSTGLQNLSSRARLQAEVFRSSHRLPTMTIDEYLEEEKRRGNVITGGGPQQDAQLTSSERLALDAAQDGTLAGEEASEAKRRKEEEWARYTELHKRGEGNTMNRG